MSGVPRRFRQPAHVQNFNCLYDHLVLESRPVFDLAVVDLMHREVASGKELSHVLFAHRLVLVKAQQ